ncbi:MAG: hypothetical protein LBK13_09470 [Spirochaetales bacterium]|jgi:hypothetical protein|nr:hypothetical protein [Spirochaetales bacterium]
MDMFGKPRGFGKSRDMKIRYVVSKRTINDGGAVVCTMSSGLRVVRVVVVYE